MSKPIVEALVQASESFADAAPRRRYPGRNIHQIRLELLRCKSDLRDLLDDPTFKWSFGRAKNLAKAHKHVTNAITNLL